ncbi:hypothetical protein ABC337_09955 [Arthrobacter sp. 1P04PC]|uniref:hypothetical protein n=1 Tax=unclassified Arthrobacter TaxID=235627 RepID=UPI00399FF42D
MNQKNPKGPARDSYWVLLSIFFAAGVAIIGLAEGFILLGASLALLTAIVILTSVHGQFRKDVVGSLSTASPGVGIGAATVVACAVLMRGSASALWAVPLLSVGASIVLYFWLRRNGRYNKSAAA